MRKPTEEDFNTGYGVAITIAVVVLFIVAAARGRISIQWLYLLLAIVACVVVGVALYFVISYLGMAINVWREGRPQRKQRRHDARQTWLHSGPDRGRRF